jgi:DeoR/GlpR family transcriptional regulator of sugar metabolism
MTRPLAINRLNQILQTLHDTGSVSVGALADQFDVSKETIRRDLKQLAEQGRVSLVHGGATVGIPAEPSLSRREAENATGKAAIGRKAASLVKDGMVILIDSGSTTLFLAEALTTREHLTVMTNSLPIALTLCRTPGVKTIMLGGEIHANDEASFGVDTLESLKHFNVDLAFVGAGGISDEGEFTDYTRLAAEQRHAMLNTGRKAYVLADNTKFERKTPVNIAPSDRIAGLIVDYLPSGQISAAAAQSRWPIMLA